MTRPGIEPATSRSQSGRSTTEPLCRCSLAKNPLYVIVGIPLRSALFVLSPVFLCEDPFPCYLSVPLRRVLFMLSSVFLCKGLSLLYLRTCPTNPTRLPFACRISLVGIITSEKQSLKKKIYYFHVNDVT